MKIKPGDRVRFVDPEAAEQILSLKSPLDDGTFTISAVRGNDQIYSRDVLFDGKRFPAGETVIPGWIMYGRDPAAALEKVDEDDSEISFTK